MKIAIVGASGRTGAALSVVPDDLRDAYIIAGDASQPQQFGIGAERAAAGRCSDADVGPDTIAGHRLGGEARNQHGK